MSDRRLRRLSRRRGASDPLEESRRISEALRIGVLPRDQVRLAAHLGHAPSKLVVGEDRYVLSCKCEGGYPFCYSCKGLGQIVVDRGLHSAIRTTCPSKISVKLIGEWACDCVSRVIEGRGGYEPLLRRVVEPVREWLKTGNVTTELAQLRGDLGGFGNVRRTTTDHCVNACRFLVAATIHPDSPICASNLGEAASAAYHAAGHSRAEREWQTNHLIGLLVRT